MDYKNKLEEILSVEAKIYGDDLLNRKIVLYGAGSLGHMALDLFDKAGIANFEIVDKKVKMLDGKIVKKLDDLNEDCKRNKLFLVAISTIAYNDIESELRMAGICNIMQFYTYAYLKFPKLLSNGWFIHDISSDIKNEIVSVCELLKHHEYSLAHYIQFCWWKMREREEISEEFKVLSGKKYFAAPVMPVLGRKEVFLDCGCHEGNIIRNFIKLVNGEYENIYAFEPDKINLNKAKEKLQDETVHWDDRALGEKIEKKNFESELGFASKFMEYGKEIIDVVAIDDLDIKPTIIKLHVEGAEYNVLEGAIETIKENRPIIMVLGDHNSDGLTRIPMYIKRLKDYKLYFLLHDYCGNSAIYYMIPKERDIYECN